MGYKHIGVSHVMLGLEVKEGVENQMIYGTDMFLENKQ